MADVAIVARMGRPGCRPAGVTASRAACRLAGNPGSLGRPAGRGSGLIGLANPYPDLGSFGFRDEVIEENAVLLLFKVEVIELNEE